MRYALINKNIVTGIIITDANTNDKTIEIIKSQNELVLEVKEGDVVGRGYLYVDGKFEPPKEVPVTPSTSPVEELSNKLVELEKKLDIIIDQTKLREY